MNPVVAAQLKEFMKNNALDGHGEVEAFEIYSSYVISNGLHNEEVDPFLMHLVGSEFGLDGVGILVQGILCVDADSAAEALNANKNASVDFIFIQSKTSEGFDYGEIAKFLDAVASFFDGGMEGESSQLDELLDAKQQIYEAVLKTNPNIYCYYIATGGEDISDRISKKIDLERSRLEEMNLFGEIIVNLFGAKRIQELYRRATSSISKTVEFSKCVTLPHHDAVEQAYIGYIEAKELLKLILIDDGVEDAMINRPVFYDNIRDFNPDSEINKSIILELKAGSGGSFVFKNNGITVVAKHIKRTGDSFTLDDYQIVNGCQTSNIIYACADDIEGVEIPIRIIGTADPDFVSSIIIGTNRQNEVKEEQFWALKPFLKDLEEYCRNQKPESMMFVERREYQYRGDTGFERTRIIKPRDLMKAVAAMLLFRPHRAARDYRGILKEFKDQIFQDDHRVEPYHCAALAHYWFDFAIRNQRVKREWKIYKYYWMFAVGGVATNGSSIFGLSKKLQKAACDNVIKSLIHEDKLVEAISKVCSTLDALVESKGLDTREQVRDLLRSDSFAKQAAVELGFDGMEP